MQLTKISPAPFVTVLTAHSSISRARPPTKKGTGRTMETDRQKIQPLTLRRQILILNEIHTHPRDSYNPCNLRIIMILFLFFVVFPIKSFIKIFVFLSLFFIMHYLHLHTLSYFIPRLWWGSTVQPLVAENLHHIILNLDPLICEWLWFFISVKYLWV